MKILDTKNMKPEDILDEIRIKRVDNEEEDLKLLVSSVLEVVKKEGDQALLSLTKHYENLELQSVTVTEDEIKRAYDLVSATLVDALKKAKANIEKFHQHTLKRKEEPLETVSGVQVWREFRPIEKVGLYVPGGKAAYPSTVLMLAIPAKIAGCKEVVMCTPAGPDGMCNPNVLVAADLCGVKNIFKLGGAQAIAAMAHGTETVPKVSKIFGPGNRYVTAAKMLAYGVVDIDMPAGPSEVLVIAQNKANPSWVAADLLSQLEHGEDSQAILIAFSKKMAENVIEEMKLQMETLARYEILQESFGKSYAIVVQSIDEACYLTNEYAPEHLEIIMDEESEVLAKINNAGSIFLGEYTNEPLGDYATGANHTLPTSGYAKMFPALSTDSFGKMIQVQRVSKEGLNNLKHTVETLATSEGLDAHKNAVSIRFKT